MLRMVNQALENFLQGFIGHLLSRQRGLQCLNPLVHCLQGVVLLNKLVVAAAAKTGHLRILVHLLIARNVMLLVRRSHAGRSLRSRLDELGIDGVRLQTFFTFGATGCLLA